MDNEDEAAFREVIRRSLVEVQGSLAMLPSIFLGSQEGNYAISKEEAEMIREHIEEQREPTKKLKSRRKENEKGKPKRLK